MKTTLAVVVASLVAVGCALPQEPTGSSEETLDLHHPTHVHVSLSKITPPENPSSCPSISGWMASKASFDPGISPLFATEVNPLLVARPPITVGAIEEADGQWSMRASATMPQGTMQVFPPEHLTSPVPVTMSSIGFATSAPIAGAWIAVIDASSSLVWIPIADVDVHGSFPTGACGFMSGEVDAHVPTGAASIGIVTVAGQRTLGELLGAAGAPTEEGWHVRMTFDASWTPVAM